MGNCRGSCPGASTEFDKFTPLKILKVCLVIKIRKKNYNQNMDTDRGLHILIYFRAPQL